MVMKRLILMGVLASAAAAPADAADYKLIAHPQVEVGQLTRDEVSRLFLKKETSLGDGSQALPVDLQSDSPTREAFSKDVHGMGVGAVYSYWQRQIFGGRSTPPLVKQSEADVVAWVSANAGAIGYVSAAAVVSGVRVIEIAD
jgi:ABC-type phosphate transport system substrate-binding protein